MYTDYAKHAIIMTKTEAREAGKYGSDKFNELNGLRAAAPNYQIMITKTPKGNRCFARLTYADMERYIKTHNVDVTVGEETKHALEVFYELCGRDKEGKKQPQMAVATYGEVKQWFLIQYPDIENTAKRIRTIMDEARRIRAERAEKESA